MLTVCGAILVCSLKLPLSYHHHLPLLDAQPPLVMALSNPQANAPHFDDYQFYLRPAQIASVSTFSTNATAPNLPGPGRVIGLGYDALGNVLVSRISRLNTRFRRQDAITVTDAQVTIPGESHTIPAGSPDEEDDPPEASASQSSFSTMATAPNLPGTGRVLGLVYDDLGSRLVKLLTKWAIKLGYSPEEASEDIFERIYQIEYKNRDKRGSGPARIGDLSKTDIAKLRKGCKRLLKYAVKSNVLDNQLQALKFITWKATTEPAIRTLLMQMNATSKIGVIYLRSQKSIYEDADVLLNRSRKALISISDTNVNNLSEALQDMFFSEETSFEHANMYLSKMLACINDRALSFLVIRHLEDLLDTCMFGHYDLTSGSFKIVSICDALEKHASRPSELVDWEDLDSLIVQWLQIWDNKLEIQNETSRIVRIICRNPDNLPESVSYLNGQAEIIDEEELQDTALTNMPFSLWSIIEEELESVDLSQVPERRLRVDVLNCGHSDLSYVWDCLLCPAVVLMRQFLLERHPLWDDSKRPPPKGGSVERVLHPERVIDIYERMVTLLSSPSSSTRSRAARFLKAIMRSDRYCWTLLSTLSRGDDRVEGYVDYSVTLEDMSPFLKYGYPLSLYRHHCFARDARIQLSSFRDCPSCRNSHNAQWQVMKFGYLAVLWLDNTLVLPYFNVEHHPIVAGYDETGQELYAAGVFADNNAYWGAIRFCMVRKDAKWVTYFDSNGVRQRAYRFHVLVFRHAKNLYNEQLDWTPASV